MRGGLRALLGMVLLVLSVPQQAAAFPAPVGPIDQRGVTIWSWTNYSYSQPSVMQALADLPSLGITDVSFVPTWWQATGTSTSVFRDPSFTSDDSSLIAGIRAAKANGLRVTLKPHVNVKDGTWRGAIAPANPTDWFASYRSMLSGYARIAQQERVEQLVIGTELAGVSPDLDRWRSLILDVRLSYTGALTYAALPFEYQRIAFWDALDSIGVNAWWRHDVAPGLPAAQALVEMKESWQGIVAELEAFSIRKTKPVVLTEAGFTDHLATLSDPSYWDHPRTSDRAAELAQQEVGYESLFRAFAGKPWLLGIHWWAWRETNATLDYDYTPQDKPAEAVVEKWWKPLLP